jgi:rRNA small subunit pseudouridine methyltransferase Nep1
VIKNPVTQYFPANALRLSTSVTGELVNITDYVAPLPDEPVVFMVGAHAHGPAEVDWAEKSLALSQYPCSASVILGRIMNAFETKWGVL